MNRISLQMYTLRNVTTDMTGFENALRKLRKIGFETIQFSIPQNFDAKAVKKLFDAYKMKNDSVFCPFLSLEERESEMLEQCELFDTKYVRVDSIPTQLVSPAGFKMFAHYLNEVGEGYKKQGKKLIYHFHAFEFINFGKETGLSILLRETDPEIVTFQPDTHWIQAGGCDPADYIKSISDRVSYVHVKDYAIGQRGPLLESTPSRFAVIGEGNLDWPKIIAACKSFDCPLYVIEQDDTYGEDPFACVKRSYDALVGLGCND